MKCEEAKSKISFLPKGELPFDDRQKVLNHLQSCLQCNKEYHEYLRMFYLIDKQVDINIPENTLEEFSSDVMKQVKISKQNKFQINRRIWYAAAAVIVFILIIPLFHFPESQDKIFKESRTPSITELIQNEDWETVLQKFEGNNIEEEFIPVSLLISKFNAIDRGLANKVITNNLGTTSKNFNDLIQLLNEYQRFKCNISTIEISNYLNS